MGKGIFRLFGGAGKRYPQHFRVTKTEDGSAMFFIRQESDTAAPHVPQIAVLTPREALLLATAIIDEFAVQYLPK